MAESTFSRQPTPLVGSTDADPSRRNNQALIASLVHHHGVLSRAELTRLTNLNRSTVGTLIGQLVQLGIVYETAPALTSQVGRPSPEVHPHPATASLAVYPEIDAVTIGLVSLGGTVQKKIRFPTERIPTAREAVNIAAAIIEGMRAELDASYRITGIGVAVPGLVNSAAGVVRHAPHLGWRNEPITAMLSEATGYACLASNDASLAAEAELLFGAGFGRANLIYLHGGASGIGGGVITDGSVLRGESGFAGEFGHTFVRTAGQACHCGATGCLETEVSQAPLLELVGISDGDTSKLEHLVLSNKGECMKAEIQRQLGYLAIGLRNAVNILNPEVIILDGFLGILHEYAPAELKSLLHNQALEESATSTHIQRAKLGSDLMMIGAAELAFTRFLADPARITGASPYGAKLG